MDLFLPNGKTLEQQRNQANVAIHETVSILPSEKDKIWQCLIDEQRSYQCQQEFSSIFTIKDLEKAINNFAARMENRCTEIGFKCLVSRDLRDTDNFDFLESGALVWHPIVQVVERLQDNYDIDKDVWETKHGLEDGHSYTLSKDGKKQENKDKIIL